MNMNKIFTQALGIQAPWFIENISFNAKAKRLDIRIKFERGATFAYAGEGEYKAYDTIEKEWRHLNFFEHECYLQARVPRVKTDDGSIHLIMPEWSGLQNGFTLLFEALIIQLASNMPVSKVAKLTNISNHKVWSILDKYVEEARDKQDYSDVSKVGVDETSSTKGHNYITLFVDLATKSTLFVAEGKDNKTCKAFIEDLEAHGGHASNITDVSCDMSPAFIKGVKENMPEAKITFDKFHVLKLINEAVDKVRRNEAKENSQLKGTRYIFLKNERNLTQKQRKQKEELLLSKAGVKSFKALRIREAFQMIYEAETEKGFTRLLKEWYFWATHSRLEPIINVAKTIKKHWDGILSWKVSQITNGILEGLNSIIQAAKRKARGYKFKHFSTMVYLITSNLDFSKLNPACLPT